MRTWWSKFRLSWKAGHRHLISWWWFGVVLSAIVLGVAIGVVVGRI